MSYAVVHRTRNGMTFLNDKNEECLFEFMSDAQILYYKFLPSISGDEALYLIQIILGDDRYEKSDGDYLA